MSRRYSRIRQGEVYKRALDAYVVYLQNLGNRPRRLNSRGARGDTALAYVTPFGFDIAADELASARVNPDSYSVLSGLINGGGTGGQVANTLGANSLLDERGYRPARIIWFRNATRTVSVQRSEVTDLEYMKYNGDRDSCPFGRATATDDQIDVFNRIRAAIFAANTNLAVNRVSLQREVSPI